MKSSGSFEISNEELRDEIVGKTKPFPKYTTQILNLCNQNAQGTRPSVVGQMTELIQECPHKSYDGWKQWYLARKPQAIADAAKRIMTMLSNLKQAMDLIDEELVKAWVEDLVLVKTFTGLRFQKAILRRIARIRETTFRMATPPEESRGIDGYIGEKPVSIKPDTYKYKSNLPESIKVPIIYYKKEDNGIHVDAREVLGSDTVLQ